MKRSAEIILEECDAIETLVLWKNAAHRDATLNPARVFSKAEVEQIKVRVDDKLLRMAMGSVEGLGSDEDESGGDATVIFTVDSGHSTTK